MNRRELTERFVRAMLFLRNEEQVKLKDIFLKINMRRSTWDAIRNGRQFVQEEHVKLLEEHYPVTKKIIDSPSGLQIASEPTTPYQRLIEAVERENEALRKYCEMLEERLRELQQRLNDMNPKP